MSRTPLNPPIAPELAEAIKATLRKEKLDRELPSKAQCYLTKMPDRCGGLPLPVNARCSLCGRVGRL